MNSFNAGQVSSDTSDPSTAHMRVFVGNLNTANITKPTLQNVFGKYGAISAISIHRGFAFIQYNTPFSARNAVQGEHGSVIAGQTIDINISSEPKPNQKPATQQGAAPHAFGGHVSSVGGPFTKRGRGSRGGARGSFPALSRGGARGRGAMRGRGGGTNKVQSGRVEKSQFKKKPLLMPLTTKPTSAENPVILKTQNHIKGTITAATAPDGTQTIDLANLKQELTDVRDKINTLLKFFPANLIVKSGQGEVSTNNGAAM